MASSSSRVICDRDIDFDSLRTNMEFYLTYEGPLKAASQSDTRARHKHEIRKHFHPQLKMAWSGIPNIDQLKENTPPELMTTIGKATMPWVEYQAYNCTLGNYHFVPLVSDHFRLSCGVDILFLRPGPPGTLVKSGDIDNRLKTLFDALSRPLRVEQLGGYVDPTAEENPFFVLADDDKLISRISVETGTLLLPTLANENEVRLTIKVTIKPVGWSFGNQFFL